MAVGKEAEQIWKLIDDCGTSERDRHYNESYILDALVRHLDVGTLEHFVESFRRNHEMIEHELEDDRDTDILDDEQGDLRGFEEFHLCMNCQESYDINKLHMCESTHPPLGAPRYFSSLIPEC